MRDVYNVEGIGAFGSERLCSVVPWSEAWIMRFAVLNIGRAGLCLAVWLCGAPGSTALGGEVFGTMGLGSEYADLINPLIFQESMSAASALGQISPFSPTGATPKGAE